MEAILILADGRTFSGRGFGARGVALGEVVFNTAMTGYQEVLTDPSYCGQMVAMTQPLMGNYGVNPEDVESRSGRVWPAGFIVREAAAHYSNPRAVNSLAAYLKEHGVVGIEEVDTRALTRHLREHGAVAGAIAPASADRGELAARVRAWGSMAGRDLVAEVTCAAPYTVAAEGPERFRVCAYDFGAKASIFRNLARRGITVHVFPAAAPAEELLARSPDGIVLSNGPGDPAACAGAIANVRSLLGQRPLFGICLGHQLLALALGGSTYKLPFGHHGGNHPVRELATGKVEITAQNHGFAVDGESLAARGATVTHVNLNDGSVEGFEVPDLGAFAVQYHPEAAPGPHDARHLFARFLERLEKGR